MVPLGFKGLKRLEVYEGQIEEAKGVSFWEADSRLASEVTPHLSCELKVSFYVHRSWQMSSLEPLDLKHSYFSYSSCIYAFISSDFFSAGFSTEIMCAFLIYPFLRLALPVSSSLMWSPWWYLAESRNYKALQYAVFSGLPLFPPFR
jgi:hypothetical protein